MSKNTIKHKVSPGFADIITGYNESIFFILNDHPVLSDFGNFDIISYHFAGHLFGKITSMRDNFSIGVGGNECNRIYQLIRPASSHVNNIFDAGCISYR